MTQKRVRQTKESAISNKKQKALKISVKEGAFASSSSAIGETYITPFALALKANTVHIGFLSAISGLVAPIAQLYGSRMMEHRSRKKIVLTFVLLQALMWIPIASLSYFAWKGYEQTPLILLIAFFMLFAIFSGIIHPSWFSWMGDLVPSDQRGRYFSKRNRVTGLFALVVVIIGALLLDLFKTRGLVLLGFVILSALSLIFRMISFSFLKRQYHPSLKLKKDYYFSLRAFLRRFDNYGKFAVFSALFNFALMIASPFFSVYMLEELNFSYVTYMAVTMSSSVFYLLFVPFVGRFSDRYGNRKLLILSCFLFGLNPFLWILITNPIVLILIPQVIVGLANAAFVISIGNFTYDAVKPHHLALCTSYSNILSGFGVFLGSLIGGFLIKIISPSFLKPYIFVFALSGTLRLIAALIFVPKIKEVRKVKRLPPMHINLIHPFRTLYSEIGWFRKVLRKEAE